MIPQAIKYLDILADGAITLDELNLGTAFVNATDPITAQRLTTLAKLIGLQLDTGLSVTTLDGLDEGLLNKALSGFRAGFSISSP